MGTNDGALSAIKKAFDEGYKGFFVCDEVKKMPIANPYPLKSVLAREWQRGFDRGFWEQQKKNENHT